MKIVGTATLIHRLGLQNARALLNRNGNGKRFLELYTAYVERCKSEFNITAEALFETYRESVRKQIDGTVGHASRATIPNATPDKNTAIDMLGGLADNAAREITG